MKDMVVVDGKTYIARYREDGASLYRYDEARKIWVRLDFEPRPRAGGFADTLCRNYIDRVIGRGGF